MKVKMQGAIQKWVDHSISVTVNLPNSVDEDLVNRLYVEAWRSGCKGCTIYRDGSRSGVLVSTQKTEKKKKEADAAAENNAAKQLPVLTERVRKYWNATWYASRTTRKNGWLSSDCSTDIPTKSSPVCRTTRKASHCPKP